MKCNELENKITRKREREKSNKSAKNTAGTRVMAAITWSEFGLHKTMTTARFVTQTNEATCQRILKPKPKAKQNKTRKIEWNVTKTKMEINEWIKCCDNKLHSKINERW